MELTLCMQIFRYSAGFCCLGQAASSNFTMLVSFKFIFLNNYKFYSYEIDSLNALIFVMVYLTTHFYFLRDQQFQNVRLRKK